MIQQIVGRIPAAPLENGIFSCHTEQLWPPYLCAQYGVYMVGAAWDWRDGSVFVAPLVATTLARFGAVTAGRPRSNRAVFV